MKNNKEHCPAEQVIEHNRPDTYMRHYLVCCYFITCLFITSSASATSLLPITLEQLSTRATLIFYGEVISNQVKKDAQSRQIATFTEFKVIDLIKGDAAATHTIKQLGGIDEKTNINFRVHGVPRFQPGKHYVVFLPERSNHGFSSPLGLYQGSFSVSIENGEQIIRSGRNLSQQKPTALNKNAQVPLAVDPEKPTQALLSDFLNTVRAYTAQ
ncbi:MAG: hypothetical protein KAT12_06080 [Gammaproteobacteria bacterium]|nr:hypothetical protein [Gammaproteobacteria bacterium]